jgi:hypothetical protein
MAALLAPASLQKDVKQNLAAKITESAAFSSPAAAGRREFSCTSIK